jgi:hypothetical protein
VALPVLGALVPVLALLWYHDAAFGSPWKTGYDYSETFAHFHQQGFLGLTELRAAALWGSTFAADNGLFTFSPVLLLAPWGWVVMARRRQYWHLGLTLAVVVTYLLFISAINFWRGGWQMGPRYITVMLPFMMVPVAAALSEAERRWATRAVAVGLVTVGVVVYAVSCAVFPHFPERFANPLHEVTFRLLGDDLVAYNAGWLLGLRGVVSAAPYGLMLAGVLGWMAWPRRPGGVAGRALDAAAGLGLAALVVVAYGAFPGGGAAAERAYAWITTVMPR